jgi:hypothetical protein
VEPTAPTAYDPRPRVDGESGVSSLQIVCAWCQQPLAWYHVQTRLPFPISYSICGRCYAAVAREFAPLMAGAVSPGRRAAGLSGAQVGTRGVPECG